MAKIIDKGSAKPEDPIYSEPARISVTPPQERPVKLNRMHIEAVAKRALPKDLDPEALGRAVESVKPEYQDNLDSFRARPESRMLGPEWTREKEPLTPEQQAQWEQMTREAFDIGPQPKDFER